MREETKKIINQLPISEKVKFVTGADFWHLHSLKEANLKEIMVTDGPHGLRKQAESADHLGIGNSVKSTCYPPACTLASSWDLDLVHQVGEHIGEECLSEEVSVILGPGANIKRSPLCGRNFEYYSEDPVLSGELSAAFINGVQSKNVGTSLKHYVANNQEDNRMIVDAVIDERTLNEIYLRSFEIPVKKAQPWTIMCSYNKVNGTYLSENKKLLNDTLRTKWDFKGLVVTDWGAANDRVQGLIAGNDLEMPGNIHTPTYLEESINNQTLDPSVLDEAVERVVDLIEKSSDVLNKEHSPYNKEEHHEFARKVAAESTVLLKNDGLLPLNENKSVALIGDFAKNPRYQGAGSSQIQPTKIGYAYDAIKAHTKGEFYFAKGYSADNDEINHDDINEAISVAKKADQVVLMIGLTAHYESEGFDRRSLSMPESHLALLNELLKVRKDIIVAISTGSAVIIPNKEEIGAIVLSYLGGQASGEALSDVLFGDVNPSGKLAETFPNSIEENPVHEFFPGVRRQVRYQEGLYIGYRFYDKAKVVPSYPFGYGLSYTTFNYANLAVSVGKKQIKVTYDVTNTGTVPGKEISQVYVSKSDSVIYRPEKELKGFAKTELNPGETKNVEVSLPLEYLEVYNVDSFKLENGEYNVHVGSSSKDILLSEKIKIKSTATVEEVNDKAYQNLFKGQMVPTESDFAGIYGGIVPPVPAVKPYHINSCLGEIKHNIIGKSLVKKVGQMMQEQFGDGNEMDASMKAMLDAMLDGMPLRALVMMSGGAMSQSMADGLIDMMNGKIFKGIKKLSQK